MNDFVGFSVLPPANLLFFGKLKFMVLSGDSRAQLMLRAIFSLSIMQPVLRSWGLQRLCSDCNGNKACWLALSMSQFHSVASQCLQNLAVPLLC